MKVSELLEVFQAASKSLDKASKEELTGFWIGGDKVVCQGGYSQTVVKADLGIGSGYIIDNRILRLLLKSDPEKTVKIERKGDVIMLRIGRNKYSIPLVMSEFYDWQSSETEEHEPFALRGRLFSDMMSSVVSASSDLSDSPLSGVVVTLSKEESKSGATNGKEMAYCCYPQDLSQVEKEVSFLLPLKSVLPIIQLLKEVNLFLLTVDESFATFQIGDVTHKVRLKENRNYPPIFQLLEGVKDLPMIGVISPKQMLSVLARLEIVAALSKKEVKKVRLEVVGSLFSVSIQHDGETMEEIEIEASEGVVTATTGKILVDLELLKKALKAFSGFSSIIILFDKGRLALKDNQKTRLMAGFLAQY